ncbi:hypothetical protein [Actinomadura parmotrematis]|uniref:Integral membrane protein n=1 Tax=Actinomadura parmotrematis TaxID=2864039 RepID=A0ABS7G339_9ACTN|nr:hypothetical protein [Actinomadura parmotrematis]MBW8486279.1 hypothetical protein [Actinomadura parmotrematis]
MSTQTKVIIGMVIAAVVVLVLPIPGWLVGLLVLGIIALPAAGYLMLDPSQRRRLRAQGRKRLGSGR